MFKALLLLDVIIRVLSFPGRKMNLAGSTLKGQADIDMLLDLVADFVAVRFRH